MQPLQQPGIATSKYGVCRSMHVPPASAPAVTTQAMHAATAVAETTTNGSLEKVEDVLPLTETDIRAIKEFHSRGFLDFLIVGDVSTGNELKTVHDFLLSIGANETKLIVKLKVCFVCCTCGLSSSVLVC
jgi:hypothetical protein